MRVCLCIHLCVCVNMNVCVYVCVCVWPSCAKATAAGRGTYLPQFLTAGLCSCPFPHMKGQQSQCVYMHVCVCVRHERQRQQQASLRNIQCLVYQSYTDAWTVCVCVCVCVCVESECVGKCDLCMPISKLLLITFMDICRWRMVIIRTTRWCKAIRNSVNETKGTPAYLPHTTKSLIKTMFWSDLDLRQVKMFFMDICSYMLEKPN